MRSRLSICLWLIACAVAQAQLRNYEESEMYKRWDSSAKRVMAAVNNRAAGKKSGKDPMLENSMNNKAFQGGGKQKYDRAATIEEFRYDQKSVPGSYKETRTFFGIKNPWFGAKTYESTTANLVSKGGMANLDRKFGDKEVKVNGFSQAEKTATKQEELRMKTGTFIPNGNTSGAVKQVNERLGKEMTIDQVRDLLNKESKTSAAGNL